jgi:hypothetical protein
MNLAQLLNQTIKVAEKAGEFIVEQQKDFSIDVVFFPIRVLLPKKIRQETITKSTCG